jgi:hypothetical protein
MSRPWGVNSLDDMIGSPSVQSSKAQLGWFRAIPSPYRKSFREAVRAAWWVIRGKAEAVVWPTGGEIDRHLEDARRLERERCANIAQRHLAMVGGNPSTEADIDDPVSRGYANAAHNILMEIAGPRFVAPSKAKQAEETI